VSYNKYLKDLSNLSDSILDEKEKMKTAINSLNVDAQIKNKLLNLL